MAKTVTYTDFAEDGTMDVELLDFTPEAFDPTVCIVCKDAQPNYTALCCINALCKTCLADYAVTMPADAVVVTAERRCNSCTRVLEIAHWATEPPTVVAAAAVQAAVAKYHAWRDATAGYGWLLATPRAVWEAEQTKVVGFVETEYTRAGMFVSYNKYVAALPSYTFTPPGYVVRGPSDRQYVQRHEVAALMERMAVAGAFDKLTDAGHPNELPNTLHIGNPNVTPQSSTFPLPRLLLNPNTTYDDITAYACWRRNLPESFLYNLNYRPSRTPNTYVWTSERLRFLVGTTAGQLVIKTECRQFPELEWPLAEMRDRGLMTPREYMEAIGQPFSVVGATSTILLQGTETPVFLANQRVSTLTRLAEQPLTDDQLAYITTGQVTHDQLLAIVGVNTLNYIARCTLSKNPSVTVKLALSHPAWFHWKTLSGAESGITTQAICDHPNKLWDYHTVLIERADLTVATISTLMNHATTVKQRIRLVDVCGRAKAVLPLIYLVDKGLTVPRPIGRDELFYTFSSNPNLTYEMVCRLPPGTVTPAHYVCRAITPVSVLLQYFQDYRHLGKTAESNVIKALPFDFVTGCPDVYLHYYKACHFGVV